MAMIYSTQTLTSIPIPIQTHKKPSTKFLSLLLKATIMALLVALFFLFVGIAVVTFLHCCSDAASYLPVTTGSAAVKEDCAVCLEGLADGEWCRSLPKCRHVFHAACVDRWLAMVANCPVCRAPVKLGSGATRSIMEDDDCKLLWAVGF